MWVSIMADSKRFRKIFRTNMLYISVFVLIFCFVAASLFIVFSSSVQKERINMFEMDESGKTESSLMRVLTHISSSCVFFSTQNFYIDAENPENDYLQIYAIQKQMQTLCATFSAVESIRIVDRITGFTISYGANFSVEQGRLYSTIGNVGIYENLNGTSPNIYMYTSAEEGQYAGNTVYIGINAEYLAENILFNKSEEREEYITDKNGNIIVSSNVLQINKNLADIYGENIKLKDGESYAKKIGGTKKILTSKKVENFDFYIFSVTENSIYRSLEKESVFTILIIIGMLAAASIFIVFMILKITYRPVEEILSQVGDMAHLDKNSMSEVQFINQNFKKLKSSNSELSDIIDEKVEELTNQHIAALQAQICPHFTYNTLDAINWIAYRTLKDRNNDISKVIRNMSVLYKSTLNINEIFRTIREEIEFTKCYIEILLIRRPNTFFIEWDVDDNLNDYKILKLSIQPLIENISNHAVGEGHEKIHIKISIKNFGELIKVTVSDDGVGIPPEKLEQIRRRISDFATDGKNLGIRNVNERLQLLYGEEYGIYISSTVDKGTTCTFIFPKVLKPE